MPDSLQPMTPARARVLIFEHNLRCSSTMASTSYASRNNDNDTIHGQYLYGLCQEMKSSMRWTLTICELVKIESEDMKELRLVYSARLATCNSSSFWSFRMARSYIIMHALQHSSSLRTNETSYRHCFSIIMCILVRKVH